MSTKCTIAYGDTWHLYRDIADDKLHLSFDGGGQAGREGYIETVITPTEIKEIFGKTVEQLHKEWPE